jgi:hypothetical protein
MQQNPPRRPTQEERDALDDQVGAEAVYRDRPLLARVRINGLLMTEEGVSIDLVLVRDWIGGGDGPEPRDAWQVYACWDALRRRAESWSCPQAGWYLDFNPGLARALDEFCMRPDSGSGVRERYERAMQFIAFLFSGQDDR